MQGTRKTQQTTTSSALIFVKVVPRSSRILIQSQGDNLYKVKLTAPPVEGEANAQLIKVLSDRLSIPRRQISIVSGTTSHTKKVQIQGLSHAEIRGFLLQEEGD